MTSHQTDDSTRRRFAEHIQHEPGDSESFAIPQPIEPARHWTLTKAAERFFDAVPAWYLDGSEDEPLAYCMLRLAEDHGIVLAGVGITRLRQAISRWTERSED